MTHKGRWPGTWAAICDRCGFRFPSDQLKREWTGSMVCVPCWEPRHPQDFVRAIPDHQSPPWVRPPPEDSFVRYCSIEGKSAYPSLGIAGCMIAGNTEFTAEFLAGLLGIIISGAGTVLTSDLDLILESGDIIVTEDGVTIFIEG